MTIAEIEKRAERYDDVPVEIIEFARRFDVEGVYFFDSSSYPSCLNPETLKIYLNLSARVWIKLNVPLWNISNFADYLTITLLHEIGHHKTDSHTEKRITKPRNIWKELLKEGEIAPWHFAFRYRHENFEECKKLSTCFQKYLCDHSDNHQNSKSGKGYMDLKQLGTTTWSNEKLPLDIEEVFGAFIEN